jgi:DNA polymerase-3 subunit gamma/tau
LLVELGLMKIAALGQKKNEPTAIEEDFPLPELSKGLPTSSVNPTPQTITPVAPAMTPAPQPTVQVGEALHQEMKADVAKVRADVEAQVKQSEESLQSVPTASTTIGESESTPQVTLSGASISSLLKGSYTAASVDNDAASSSEEQGVDPRSAEKLKAAQESIVEIIKTDRPRFIVAFETMRINGYKIMLTVPSESLRDEIQHSSIEILHKIAEVADVKGKLEFEITVKEEVRRMRPIKLEDRMAHIEKRNPMYIELKKALDLEVE